MMVKTTKTVSFHDKIICTEIGFKRCNSSKLLLPINTQAHGVTTKNHGGILLNLKNSEFIGFAFATTDKVPKIGKTSITSIEGQAPLKYFNKLMFIKKNLFSTYFSYNHNQLGFLEKYSAIYNKEEALVYSALIKSFAQVYNEEIFVLKIGLFGNSAAAHNQKSYLADKDTILTAADAQLLAVKNCKSYLTASEHEGLVDDIKGIKLLASNIMDSDLTGTEGTDPIGYSYAQLRQEGGSFTIT